MYDDDDDDDNDDEGWREGRWGENNAIYNTIVLPPFTRLCT
jgi:hypothetical protein